jgi:hypothetical protein
MVVLGLASCVAAANTTKVQPSAPSAAAKDSTAAILGACYALDTVARHECIYAAVVRGRAAKSDAVN